MRAVPVLCFPNMVMFLIFSIPKAFQAHNSELQRVGTYCFTMLYFFLVSCHKASILLVWQNKECTVIFCNKGNTSMALLLCQKATGDKRTWCMYRCNIREKKKKQLKQCAGVFWMLMNGFFLCQGFHTVTFLCKLSTTR